MPEPREHRNTSDADQRANPLPSGLFTDLYELTMAQAYLREGIAEEPAVFELFFRTLPPRRNYVMAAGLDDVLTFLERLHFEPEDLAYLRGLGMFRDEFLERLAGLRFTGDVYAAPEGTIVFADEPLVQVVGPILEAQIVETFLLNQVHFQSLVATKAARLVTAAPGRSIVDFGSRRAHGVDAAMKVARASYLAGLSGTSNVLAGRLYGIPLFGTMAHSYVQAHESEARAFEAFAGLYPETTLLVDTYDSLEGVRRVIQTAQLLRPSVRIGAIRLDSGDLADLARRSRRLLDDAGLNDVKIFASSGLDEYELAGLVAGNVPIDGFGVGTRLAVSEDAPSLDIAYKLVASGGRPCLKLSTDKVIYPGPKQVFRRLRDGRIACDLIARHDEPQGGEPLLRAVMRGGVRTEQPRTSLRDAREHAQAELARLPEALRRLDAAPVPYDVQISAAVRADYERIRAEVLNSSGARSRP